MVLTLCYDTLGPDQIQYINGNKWWGIWFDASFSLTYAIQFSFFAKYIDRYIQYFQWNYIQKFMSLKRCDYELNVNSVVNNDCTAYASYIRPIWFLIIVFLVFTSVLLLISAAISTHWFIEITGLVPVTKQWLQETNQATGFNMTLPGF